MIISATYEDETNESVVVVYSDNSGAKVPKAKGNRHYRELMEWVAEGNTIQTYVEPPKPAPQVVSMRQARLALLQNNLLSQVDSAIASMPSPDKEAAQIEWEYATDVRRDNQLFAAMAAQLGLSESDLDDLFTLAASL